MSNEALRLFFKVVIIAVAILLIQRQSPSKDHVAAGNEMRESERPLSELLIAMREKSAIILDVRAENAFRNGHVPGAVNIPFYDITRPGFRDRLPTGSAHPIFVYGDTTGATQAAERLRESGVTNEIFTYRGGWSEWVRCGLPQNSL
jgi:rhodanese-related sulfurtransferase